MTRPTDKDMLLNLVPKDGSFVGNGYLQSKLNWKENKYWDVRNKLLLAGQLERGKGKGGSVRRCDQTFVDQLSTKPIRNTFEAQLYEPLLKVLSNEWVREMRIEPEQIQFEITAKQGKKITGGTWTRPDITAVSVRAFQHLPNKYVDVWTFEVKPIEALDVTAIFEAAAHASRATRSYALLQIAKNSGSSYDNEVIERCAREAARLRVGLIVFSSESDFSTWETKVEAPRLETAPEVLDEFIGYLSEKSRARIARWK